MLHKNSYASVQIPTSGTVCVCVCVCAMWDADLSEPVGLRAEARDEPLVLGGCKGRAAHHRVPHAVVEGPQPHAPNVELAGIPPPLVAGHLTKIPGLPVDVQPRTIHPVLVQGERTEGLLDLLHGAHHQVAHDIKSVAINLQQHQQQSELRLDGPAQHQVAHDIVQPVATNLQQQQQQQSHLCFSQPAQPRVAHDVSLVNINRQERSQSVFQ